MRILVVEDDMIIAGSLCPLVAKAGHELVGLAADMGSAIGLLDTTPVDLILLDIGLADGPTGLEVARHAATLGVPFVFMTGNLKLLFGDFSGAVGIISKPYDDRTAIGALRFLTEAFAGRPVAAPPRGFVLSLPWIERFGLNPESDAA